MKAKEAVSVEVKRDIYERIKEFSHGRRPSVPGTVEEALSYWLDTVAEAELEIEAEDQMNIPPDTDECAWACPPAESVN